MQITRRRVVVTVIVLLGASWLTTLTVLIAQQPEAGVPSPSELRTTLEQALNSKDAKALETVLDYPPSAAADFAKSYAARFTQEGARDVRVTLAPAGDAPTTATVTGVLADGRRFGYPLALKEDGGNWSVAFVPPFSP
ncbi:hypothetical protein [Amycolatopsis sp. CA-230715]|uniref:hypothetical protein n=1 Tax=Amycolatopsis sp. CA-230715 TaxID=2745196 RepID=UPI001C036319|nr:hypothetical protein [Amycolatopsis sp. CA-230715]QWF82797.1 hypothetical protein HUW46_06236 [Amycolatopsis sp. CA-230715]